MVATVTELHRPQRAPVIAGGHSDPSPGLASPLIEEARILRLHDDFKPLSDLHRRDLDGDAIAHWQAQFAALAAIAPERRPEARRELLQRYRAAAYEAEDSCAGDRRSVVLGRRVRI